MSIKSRSDQISELRSHPRRRPLQTEEVEQLLAKKLSPEDVTPEPGTTGPKVTKATRAALASAGTPLFGEVDTMSPRQLAIHCGDDTYEGKPCRSCGDTERRTADNRCATCSPKLVRRNMPEISRLHPNVFTPMSANRLAANSNRPDGSDDWSWAESDLPPKSGDWWSSKRWRAVIQAWVEAYERGLERRRSQWRERYHNDPAFRERYLAAKRARRALLRAKAREVPER